jgi:hypothetical protein
VCLPQARRNILTYTCVWHVEPFDLYASPDTLRGCLSVPFQGSSGTSWSAYARLSRPTCQFGSKSSPFSIPLGQIDLREQTTAAFILTFAKGFDNFYANVWHLSGTKNG